MFVLRFDFVVYVLWVVVLSGWVFCCVFLFVLLLVWFGCDVWNNCGFACFRVYFGGWCIRLVLFNLLF